MKPCVIMEGSAISQRMRQPWMEQRGSIHSVETCGAVDGPGLRYVLFTHGCPLRCQYCHNPDTQGRTCGSTISAREVIEELKTYRSYMRRGGITISGGEPLMQPEFIHAVFTGAKEAGFHTALDTSGFLGARASDALLSQVDLVLLDIKSGLPGTYKRVTGVDLEPTLQFSKRLEALGKSTWIRFVLVPGLTDAPENIEAVAKHIAPLTNVERVEILPFHKMAEDKYQKLGKTYNLQSTRTPTREEMDKAHALFRKHGIEAL